jgi:hypothetical protein
MSYGEVRILLGSMEYSDLPLAEARTLELGFGAGNGVSRLIDWAHRQGFIEAYDTQGVIPEFSAQFGTAPAGADDRTLRLTDAGRDYLRSVR